MSWRDPNLARAPYENARPVERLAWLLWFLACVVTAAALWVAVGARRDAGGRQAALLLTSKQAVSARDEAARLKGELERMDLAGRNVRTEFLNERIAERAFSWNDLFDALALVMPRGVRLQSLTPQGFTSLRAGKATSVASPARTQVTMIINGEAEDTEALLEFVDRLYAHVAFAEPKLSHEATEKNLQIRFNLSVKYVPGWRAEARAILAQDRVAGASPAAASTLLPGTEVRRPVETPAADIGAGGIAAPVEIRELPSPTGAFRPRLQDSQPNLGRVANEPGEEDFSAGAKQRRADPAEGRAATPPRAPTFMLPAPLKPYASAPGGSR